MNLKDTMTEQNLQKINQFERLNMVQRLKTDDIYSLGLLQSLLTGYPFLPFTGSSMRPFCLVHIINDIVINNRKNILEFGSGISTILIGRLIKRNNLNATILSIEHDQAWMNELELLLKNEKLDDVVSVFHAPLKKCELALESNEWYDTDILDSNFQDKKFDAVIVDGPPAWEISKNEARFPAVPYVIKKLSADFSLYLDDANRPGERSVLELWGKEYGLEFKIAGDTIAYCYGGKSFYTEPFVYS